MFVLNLSISTLLNIIMVSEGESSSNAGNNMTQQIILCPTCQTTRPHNVESCPKCARKRAKKVRFPEAANCWRCRKEIFPMDYYCSRCNQYYMQKEPEPEDVNFREPDPDADWLVVDRPAKPEANVLEEWEEYEALESNKRAGTETRGVRNADGIEDGEQHVSEPGIFSMALSWRRAFNL
jgi:hypothetical protein